MVNTLSLDAPSRSRLILCKSIVEDFIKVSRFMRALDLANFDDWNIILDDDLRNPWAPGGILSTTPISMDGHASGGPQAVPPPKHYPSVPPFKPEPQPEPEPMPQPKHRPKCRPIHVWPGGMLHFSSQPWM